MDERPATAHVSVWSLLAAIAVGLFLLAPLVLLSFAWAPAIVLAGVLAAACVFVLIRLVKRDKGIASNRIGVRGERFAELVRPTGLVCPRCAYDLAGAQGDRCPECGEDLELVVRTQIHYEFVQDSVGQGVSERDMRGLPADTAKVLGYAILLPALAAPAAIIALKAASGRTPAVFSMAALVYTAAGAWKWWRRNMEGDLPRQRSEAVLALAIAAGLAVVCSLIDLAY